MKRLVLDLRNNSGGSLDAAIGIVDCFVREGTIVSTKGRRAGDNHTWTATGNAQYRDLPLVVMINHASASASEIVAGALQDHDRALVVGQTSFGKGLVMNPYELTLNRRELGTFMLTIARYYTPSGRLIQRPYDGTREEYLEEGLDDYDPNEEETSLADRPVFKTDLKRDVYGGGGITPDRKLSSPRRLNRLESDLRATNLLFEFADGYILRHTDIPREFSVFLASYHIPEDEFTRFKSFITDKNISLEDETTLSDDLKQVLTRYNLGNEQKTVEDALSARGVDFGTNLFEKSHGFIERELKMELARMLWGPEERYRVWHSDDTELIEAVGYFKDAEELLQRRLAIGNP